MIPAGWTAKLIWVPDPYSPDFWVSEVCDKLKFIENAPVIILAGAWGIWAGKVLAGIAWAAFRAGAYVIDSGVGSGIEKFCMRKSKIYSFKTFLWLESVQRKRSLIQRLIQQKEKKMS